MLSDIEIARSIPLRPIADIGLDLGIPSDALIPYGRYMAKVDEREACGEKMPDGHLVLVTAMSPTKAGIGKTTMSVGLALGLTRLGKKAVLALREPSLGPCFGMKGGAAGGGYAQVLPMEKINLHFTGDFHAITSANNMIAALLDNHIHQHRDDGFALKQVLWRRVLDVNDRSLRYIVTGLGPKSAGVVQGTGFDITPASEIMAILCLATDEADLRRRIDNILLGITIDDAPFTVRDLGVGGAIMALLKDAFAPNLVQTTEHTPAFVHGGPFANIAHGCNSIITTRMAMRFGEYAVTEAGFGADLGAEKFLDIKCRRAGIQPSLTVLVVTMRALKLHGGCTEQTMSEPNFDAVYRGTENMDRHIRNLQRFGQTVVVALNHYGDDSEAEIEIVRQHLLAMGVGFALNKAFVEGGRGAEELARLVVDTIEQNPSQPLRFTYEEQEPAETKIEKVAKGIYGAGDITYSPAARRALEEARRLGYGHLPVCIAKTQYSFSTDPKRTGVADGAPFHVRDIAINAGAEMLIVIAGDIMRMPGLPKDPQARRIDVVDGEIEGLS